MESSLSDNEQFLGFCLRAVADDELFNNFKRNEIYNDILEHVSFQQGNLYLKHIIKRNRGLIGIIKLLKCYKNLKKFKKNDIIGNPKVYKYPIVGYISPTTLRYISIMLELEDYFGSLEGLNICEIGGGYGGQYKIIDSYFKINTYTIIDLEPSLLLTKKFLSNYKLNSKIEFVKPDELKNSTFDLVISNYAFSELNKISQDDYIHKVINFSNCGFMIYNNTTPVNFNTYTAQEIVDMFDNAFLIPEKPKTGENSFKIIWGKKDKKDFI